MLNKIMCSFIICVFVNFHSILVAQNVGIGTITPAEKLDVNGNIKVDTLKPNALLITPNAGIGKILTSDDAGNANWEALVLPPPPNNYNGNIGYGVWGDCATNGNISAYQPVADLTAGENRGFGCSVSVSGNVAVVGAYADNPGIPFQGSASIFVFNGMSWDFFQKLSDPEGASGDQFGDCVSISGDNIIIGSPRDDESYSNQGSACFFHFNGTSWDFVEKIHQVQAAAGNEFGRSVNISGERAIIGAPFTNASQGAASMYQFDGTSWQFMNQVAETFGSIDDYFGLSVGIIGDMAIVGVRGDDIDGYDDAGSAIVFQFNGTNWALLQKLSDATGSYNHFGSAVAISENNILVGAPDTNLSYADQGKAYMYRFNGTTWIVSNLFTDIHPTPMAFYGTSVNLSGSYA
ncbi:MAG: hypothetical protein ABJB16_16680, partial [Saprospiraceae bacterium]